MNDDNRDYDYTLECNDDLRYAIRAAVITVLLITLMVCVTLLGVAYLTH